MKEIIKNLKGQKGQVTIGLLLTVLLVVSLFLWNAPNLSLTNQVAYATGTTLVGGGGPVGSVATLGSSTVLEDALTVLTRVSQTPVSTLAAGGVSGLNSEIANVVTAISTLTSDGRISSYVNLATSAIRQLLIATIQVTLEKVQARLLVLLSQ